MVAATLDFADAREWRAWLEENHARTAEAILLVPKKSTPHGVHYEEALQEALCFGWIDSRGKAHDAERFIVRFSPRKRDSVWSESNRTRVNRLIRSGRMTPAGLAAVREAKRSGAWDNAVRPSARPRMPADLGRALRANPEARAHFRGWGDSYQSACIRWVMDAKRRETRDRRIRRIVGRAAEDQRPGIEGF